MGPCNHKSVLKCDLTNEVLERKCVDKEIRALLVPSGLEKCDGTGTVAMVFFTYIGGSICLRRFFTYYKSLFGMACTQKLQKNKHIF